MKWKCPFIVYRITAENRLEEVFHCDEIKKARYWLQYIAQAGDVLCRTPLHPKHSKITQRPEYWSHKEKSGKTVSEAAGWKKFAESCNFAGDFPEEQMIRPAEQPAEQSAE